MKSESVFERYDALVGREREEIVRRYQIAAANISGCLEQARFVDEVTKQPIGFATPCDLNRTIFSPTDP